MHTYIYAFKENLIYRNELSSDRIKIFSMFSPDVCKSRDLGNDDTGTHVLGFEWAF